MIKIEIVQDFIDPNEELTKEKCMLYIRHINDTIKQSRANIYQLFLGKRSLRYAFILMVLSFLMYMIFKSPMILMLMFFEISAYLVLSIILSEYLNKKIRHSLLLQQQYFKDKLKKLSS